MSPFRGFAERVVELGGGQDLGLIGEVFFAAGDQWAEAESRHFVKGTVIWVRKLHGQRKRINAQAIALDVAQEQARRVLIDSQMGPRDYLTIFGHHLFIETGG